MSPFVAALSYGAAAAIRNVTIAFLVLIAALAGPVYAQKVTILALGDSLTAGYGLPPEDGFVPQLQAWLSAAGAEADIINAGVSGDTTAGGLARLDWSLTPEVDAMIVNLGGNDLLRGVDPTSSAANLDKILATAQARDLPVLLVGLKALNNYGPDFKTQFDAIYPSLSAKYAIPLYPDYFAALKSAPDQTQALAEYMQGDGIHPNAAGVKRVLDDLGPSVLDLVKRAQK